MFTFLFIGLFSGAVLAFSGSGGGVIAIPLFLYFAHLPLNDATFYSLVVITTGALGSWWSHRKEAHFPTTLLLSGTSWAVALLTHSLKGYISTSVVQIILIIICLLSISLLWIPKKNRPPENHHSFRKIRWEVLWLSPFLGPLANITGIGGGIFLIPFLYRVLNFSYTEAASISMFCVGTTTLVSFLSQAVIVKNSSWDLALAISLFSGVALSVVAIRNLNKRLDPVKLEPWRKLTLTFTLFISMCGIAWH